MSNKINEQLLQQMCNVEQIDPERKIPIIVTISSGADISVLERSGLKFDRYTKSISAVADSLTAAQIKALELLDQVEYLEYDGKTHIV